MSEYTREELDAEVENLLKCLKAGEVITVNTTAALELCADGVAVWDGSVLVLRASPQHRRQR